MLTVTKLKAQPGKDMEVIVHGATTTDRRRSAMRKLGTRSLPSVRRGKLLLIASASASVLVASVLLVPGGSASPQRLSAYTITDLGTLPGDSSSTALGVNASGQVVGYSQHFPPHGVLFDGGTVTDLGVLSPDRLGSRALAVGPSGAIVGYSVIGAGIRPVSFTGGTVTMLPLPAGDQAGAAFGVNSIDQAVGYTEPSADFSDPSNRPHGSHAVLFSGGSATLLGALPGDSQSAAYGINDAGQAVGYSQGASRQHAVLFSGGTVTDLGTLPGDTDSGAFSINASGQAAGYSAGGGRFHPVIFSGGSVIPLGELGGQRNEQALSVNAGGLAVGVSDSDGFHHHAVLYENEDAFALDAQLPAGSGWTLQTANAINDAGQIVGQGTHNGRRHAYLLTPTGAKPSGGHAVPADANPAPPASLESSAPKITVRYDYMVLPGSDGHSDAPDPAAIQAVVDSFAAHGIRLVVQPVHSAIPERYVTAFGVPVDPAINGPDAVAFDDLKAAYFPDAPSSVHYTIFGFLSDCDSDTHCTSNAPPGPGNRVGTPAYGQTGRAELPGTNFVVSLGQLYYELGLLLSGRPTLVSTGGTFMHELGHNLGLHHGGGLGPEPCTESHACEDSPNYRPNYLSVMNYKYQYSGILKADTVGSNVFDPALTRIDYSEQVLPTGGNTPGALTESGQLNEPAGLGSGNADVFTFDDGTCNFRVAATNGPVDWDGNGIPDNTNATADLNTQDHPALACTVTNQVLKGHEDWSLILASLQAHPDGFPESAHPQVPAEAGTASLMKEHALYPILEVGARLRQAPVGGLAVGGHKTLVLRGSSSFDATQVDPNSVRIFGRRPNLITTSDVNADGAPDLVLEVPANLRISPSRLDVVATGWLKNSQAFIVVLQRTSLPRPVEIRPLPAHGPFHGRAG
jgi:probable HAF family extracellular repeat protein